MNIKHLNQIGDKVIVKKGEGGGGSEGGEEHIYVPFDQLGSTMMKSMVLACATTLKFERPDGSKGIGYYGMAAMTMDSTAIREQTLAVEIIPSVIMTGNDGTVTTSEYMSSIGMDIDSLPSITKEEFYAL